jgi:hypothetical protein
MKTVYIILVLSLFQCTMCSAEPSVLPYFATRSQGHNAARQQAGMTRYIHPWIVHTHPNPDILQGTLAFNLGYSHCFRDKLLAKKLFGTALTTDNTFRVTGSQTTNRQPQDLLADYFYLPTDFSSTVSLKPRTESVIFDIAWYLDLNPWVRGLYLWAFAPLVRCTSNLHIQENVTSPGVNDYAPGALAVDSVARNKLLYSFSSYASGNATITSVPDITLQSLKFSRMKEGSMHHTKIADIQFGFGWDTPYYEDYLFGVRVLAISPVGTRPDGVHLFTPVIGNSHHWEFGGGFTGNYRIWHNDENNSALYFYGDLSLTHLFTTRQIRVFDLKQRPLSRFMLAEKLELPSTVTNAEGIPSTGQFSFVFAPLANLTAVHCNVHATAQVDFLLLLSYTTGNFSFDIGYNFWAQTEEAISLARDRENVLINNTTWAIKGDAQVFGYYPDLATSVALSATENQATIHAGTNFPATGTTDPDVIATAQTNPNVDNPQQAFSPAPTPPSPPPLLPLEYAPGLPDNADNRINTSINPIFLTVSDLDVTGAQLRGMSSTLFIYGGYSCSPCKEWTPYIGIGAQSEWNHEHSQSPYLMSVSQWTVWIKGGLAF